MDEIEWALLLVVFLTGASLFLALNNLAIRLFSRVKLQDAFRDVGKEELLEGFLENTEDMALACSVLGFISNIGILGSLGAIQLAKGYHYIFTFIIATVIFIVFCLAIPQSWAKYAGEKILTRTYKLLLLITCITKPVLAVLKLNDTLVRRLAGVTEASPDQAQEEKQEEMLSVFEEGKMEGAVDEEEMEMIENVLELRDTNAEEIMTPRTDLIALEINTPLQEVLKTISNAGHSRIPVYENNIDNIIGLVYAKDLLAEIGADQMTFKLADKIRKAYFVPETKPLRVLLHEFQNQKLHIAIVLDEYGGTAGIVTIEDILEELVGEIVDEYEETPPKIVKKLNETTIEIDARMYVDDLNEEFDLELPEDEDYGTVGGFVFSHLGYIPKTGETFVYGNVKFTIIAAEERSVKRIKIQKHPADEEHN